MFTPTLEQHYLGHLGVRPNHTLVDVHAGQLGGFGRSSHSTEAFVARARAWHVPPANIVVHEGAFSDPYKVARINERITRLPDDAWFVYADGDELFSYPCDLPRWVARGVGSFEGGMVDMLSRSGRIEPLAEEPAIHVQYPRHCFVREHLGRMRAVKMVLHRAKWQGVPVTYINPHAIGTATAHRTATVSARLLSTHCRREPSRRIAVASLLHALPSPAFSARCRRHPSPRVAVANDCACIAVACRSRRALSHSLGFGSLSEQPGTTRACSTTRRPKACSCATTQ